MIERVGGASSVKVTFSETPSFTSSISRAVSNTLVRKSEYDSSSDPVIRQIRVLMVSGFSESYSFNMVLVSMINRYELFTHWLAIDCHHMSILPARPDEYA
jgi:hypothetical protein